MDGAFTINNGIAAHPPASTVPSKPLKTENGYFI
jgi:hypothetical protein